MGLPHDGTNGTLPPNLVKWLKERVIGKRSLLGQTPVFRAHPINDCLIFGCLASQVIATGRLLAEYPTHSYSPTPGIDVVRALRPHAV